MVAKIQNNMFSFVINLLNNVNHLVAAYKKEASHQRNASNYNQSRGLIFPVLLRLANVSLVADLSHLLCFSEELLSLVRISLLN